MSVLKKQIMESTSAAFDAGGGHFDDGDMV